MSSVMLLSLALWIISAAAVRQPPQPQMPSLIIDKTPELRDSKPPDYPAEALAARVAGVIDVEVSVGSNNQVMHSRLSQRTPGLEVLERAALDAVAHASFRAAIDWGGRPVATLSIVRVEFALPAAGGKPVVKLSMRPPLSSLQKVVSNEPVADVVKIPAPGIRDPVVIRRVNPSYTSEAMRAKIVGEVWLDAIVRPDGTVTNLRVTKSLDSQFGLDNQALRAASYWLFKPAIMGDRAVACSVVLILEFRLH
jgi:TonB family protein